MVMAPPRVVPSSIAVPMFRNSCPCLGILAYSLCQAVSSVVHVMLFVGHWAPGRLPLSC